VTEALDKSIAVFSGKVVLNEKVPFGSLATFTIQQAWKGTLGKRAKVLTTNLCTLSFKVGETYLVYASGRVEGELTASTCSRTTLLSSADEDLSLLDAAKSKGSALSTVPRKGALISRTYSPATTSRQSLQTSI
jgi:hypothetical protein